MYPPLPSSIEKKWFVLEDRQSKRRLWANQCSCRMHRQVIILRVPSTPYAVLYHRTNMNRRGENNGYGGYGKMFARTMGTECIRSR